MSVFSEITKKIYPFMRTKGFYRSGKNHYYVANDIAYCLSFEKPGKIIYVTAYIMPLYIPTEFIYHTYGERLSHLSDLQFPIITEDDVDSIDEWCATFRRVIVDKILPVFMQINSPEMLIGEIERESPILKWFLRCPPVFIEQLKMYTYLYLQRFTEAEAALENYRKVLAQCSFFTKAGIQSFLRKADAVDTLIHENKEKTKEFITGIVEHTKNILYFATTYG